MYSVLRNILFSLDPEVSHELSLDMLAAAERLRLLGLIKQNVPAAPTTVMGLEFPNPVGLAAGLDKNADSYNALGAMGFGFVEVGTVTPLAQPGNPKPRLFRLEEEGGIINRMGFNNKGVDHLVDRVKNRRYDGVLGINLGKNKATAEEAALQDYIVGMQKVYAHADYITINISSPNTPGLRNLQYGESLNTLLAGIRDQRQVLSELHGKSVPIAVKIAPDNDEEALKPICEALLKYEMDAVIATNTTLSREGVERSQYKDETGGLSGRPLTERATQTISQVKGLVGNDLPIIGVGGIFSAEDAQAKISAGADLIQIYSGFIYEGPKLIKDIVGVLK